MKKIISIIISVTLLLICLSGCGNSFKQGDIAIFDDAKVIYNTSSQGLKAYHSPFSFNMLNNRFVNAENDGSLPWDKTKSIVFKATAVGKPILSTPTTDWEEFYSINYERLMLASSIITPMKIEEIYYSGEDLSMDVAVGDVVYVGLGNGTILTEELFNYPLGAAFDQFKEKTNAAVGDLWTDFCAPYTTEMLLKENESYLLFMQETTFYYFDSEGIFSCSAHFAMYPSFCISKEPKTAQELGITDSREIEAYNTYYLQIRKDAIDYYVNGNKEVLS
ncbi:MAG: hypothetical protein IJD95_06425 [Clostridia bacterium]|nr:hypothetical protein [Clostridia bacterium]